MSAEMPPLKPQASLGVVLKAAKEAIIPIPKSKRASGDVLRPLSVVFMESKTILGQFSGVNSLLDGKKPTKIVPFSIRVDISDPLAVVRLHKYASVATLVFKTDALVLQIFSLCHLPKIMDAVVRSIPVNVINRHSFRPGHHLPNDPVGQVSNALDGPVAVAMVWNIQRSPTCVTGVPSCASVDPRLPKQEPCGFLVIKHGLERFLRGHSLLHAAT